LPKPHHAALPTHVLLDKFLFLSKGLGRFVLRGNMKGHPISRFFKPPQHAMRMMFPEKMHKKVAMRLKLRKI
jgi:predicted YcjX-like family ATPase